VNRPAPPPGPSSGSGRGRGGHTRAGETDSGRAPSAYSAALKLLARRDYFREELVRRLGRKGFTADEVEAALSECDRLGLLDDPRLAERFAVLRATTRGWGPRRLEAELRRRGVEAATAKWAARLTPEVHQQALGLALRRAEARARPGWWRLPARRARMLSSLLNRGFDADEARSAVRDLATRRESQQHANDDEQGDPQRVP